MKCNILISAMLAGALGLSGMAPAAAAPIPAPVASDAGSNLVIDVHERRGFHRRGGYAYYNGHRGYRGHRDGYRRHNGYWFPRSAFTFEIIIGGASPRYHAPRRYYAPPRGYRLTRAHYRWCDAKYRSYRASDNTFQPYHGRRKQCVSPYY